MPSAIPCMLVFNIYLVYIPKNNGFLTTDQRPEVLPPEEQ